MATMSRRDYAAAYGPTTGDLVRLGDTDLLAEITHDFAHHGDELTTGAGKAMHRMPLPHLLRTVRAVDLAGQLPLVEPRLQCQAVQQ